MKFNDAIERIEKFFEREVAPFKITFDSKYKWLPYLICGFSYFLAYCVALTASVITIQLILYP